MSVNVLIMTCELRSHGYVRSAKVGGNCARGLSTGIGYAKRETIIYHIRKGDWKRERLPDV